MDWSEYMDPYVPQKAVKLNHLTHSLAHSHSGTHSGTQLNLTPLNQLTHSWDKTWTHSSRKYDINSEQQKQMESTFEKKYPSC